jgi:hypothetical protein
MFSPKMLGPHVVNGKVVGVSPAILAGIPVSPEDFSPGQFDL